MSQGSFSSAALVAIDWGTTNRRGYLIDGRGNVLDSRNDELGLVNIPDRNFEAAFGSLTDQWMTVHGSLPALLSGMVGASTGWVETKYCLLPAGLDHLAENLQPVDKGRPLWIVPGVMTRDEENMPDVMRGEETQAISAGVSNKKLLVVAPGTHSKWIQVENGHIVWFTTFMTGDMHAAILDHTVVSQLKDSNAVISPEIFSLGVKIGYAQNENLTHVLFGARTKVLFGDLDLKDVSGYLSGLLIGAEVAGAVSVLGDSLPNISLIGSEHLCSLYRMALQVCGMGVSHEDMGTIGETYLNIAKRAGILEQ